MKEVHPGGCASLLAPMGVLGSRIATRVKEFVENGGSLMPVTHSRSCSMWTQTSHFFLNFLKIFREVTPGSPGPRKPHIKVGSLSNTAPLNQQPMGVTILAHFGPFWPQPDNTPAHSAPTRDQGRHSGPPGCVWAAGRGLYQPHSPP